VLARQRIEERLAFVVFGLGLQSHIRESSACGSLVLLVFILGGNHRLGGATILIFALCAQFFNKLGFVKSGISRFKVKFSSGFWFVGISVPIEIVARARTGPGISPGGSRSCTLLVTIVMLLPVVAMVGMLTVLWVLRMAGILLLLLLLLLLLVLVLVLVRLLLWLLLRLRLLLLLCRRVRRSGSRLRRRRSRLRSWGWCLRSRGRDWRVRDNLRGRKNCRVGR